ncbi:MAG: symmetrical bis(5'-nucleosyl)-tetraphosphatase [Oceanicoccus sp.]|uniref:symmetrical bis(5'-nucleosyl)-tetraphosphatase n=1 Tax=Oceanicoccus sp. TaxID=2691044 RepID=UPI00260788A2|nr:symmetrical bis(5'-nucleosyl)-tetraphosphatase [Oceanicoccus sp.]MDG1772366.1 symmetrical bis(5'-nucleosyl)-tetraphosphatase [Oceanicoccus sp.]
MTRYAVGDVQGCLEPLQCLLEEVNFDAGKDELWLAGDLINRGPASLQTLRFVKSLGECTRIVLGNHDLHFLAIAFGTRKTGKSDTFDEILNADDYAELVQWLQQQHLFYSDPSGDYHMVHAGIPPIWTVTQARQYAAEVEQVLHSDQAKPFFEHMYGNEPAVWSDGLEGWTRLRVITNYLTRMRFCNPEGVLDFENKLATIDKPNFNPWFSYSRDQSTNIIFGHWAALEGKANSEGVFALDTGCVWGHALTLMNLETQHLHHCNCAN